MERELSMEAGLKQFVEVYAKSNNLNEADVALLAGALTSESIKLLPEYLKFVHTLEQVAPHLLQYIQMCDKVIKEKKEGV